MSLNCELMLIVIGLAAFSPVSLSLAKRLPLKGSCDQSSSCIRRRGRNTTAYLAPARAPVFASLTSHRITIYPIALISLCATTSPEMGSLATTAPEIQATAVATPHFAKPSTPKRGGEQSPVRRFGSPLKSARYTTNRRPRELHDVLSIATISPAQKELATRVSRAAEQLRQWCDEIEQWGWDGDFQLPSQEVDAYEERLDTINDELNQMEVEELKEHVLGIYLSRSRPGSSHSLQSISRLPFQFLDDYELFVTQTLVQALPLMAQLKLYLRTWSMRIMVLREVSIFLSQLRSSRQYLSSDITESWEPVSPNSPPHQLSQLQRNIQSAQKELETIIQGAGRRLDTMLDVLEGSDDCLPEEWIDEYEGLEAEYSKWTVEAENWILQIEIAKHKALTKEREEAENVIDLDGLTPMATPTAQPRGSSFLDVDSSTSESCDTSISSFIEDSGATVPGSIPTKELEDFIKAHADNPELVRRALQEDFASQRNSSSAYSNATGPSDEENALPIEKEDEPVDEEESHVTDAEEATMIRRASVTSINSFQKSQLKTVSVRRNGSMASSLTIQSRGGSVKESSSAPVSPVSPVSPSNSISKRESWFTNPTSPLSMTMVDASKDIPSDAPATPISPTIPESPDESRENSEAEARIGPGGTPEQEGDSRRDSLSSPMDSSYIRDSEVSSSVEDSPTLPRQLAKAPRHPLNSSMPKRRAQDNLTPINSNISSSPPSLSRTPSSPSKSKSPTSPQIPLQQQISAIISEIHAPIRLASSPTPTIDSLESLSTTPPAKVAKNRRLPSLRTALHTHRSVTPTPTTPGGSSLPPLTLAPASKEEARRAGATDPEIKLYHLMGREGKPIKLFVRRVGENGERVMVRVGGGWADLREYLRVYAEHHGSQAKRAASEGKVEVLGLAATGRATPEPRSVSAAQRHRRKSSLAREDAASPSPGPEFSSPFDASLGTESPGPSLVDAVNSTSVTSSPAGFPSSPPSVSASGSRRVSRSLAGPASVVAQRKTEMSDEKRDWVEGIVEQAKRLHLPGSGSSGSGGGKEKTKRVFLKGKE